MKAYFELDDRGTCASFTMIRGKARQHQFLKHANGSSRLSFEGTREQFDELMRDIYGEIGATFRTRAIFVYPEIPSTQALEAHISDLREKITAIKGAYREALDELRERDKKKPSAFPSANFVPKEPSTFDNPQKNPPEGTTRLAEGSASPDPDASLKSCPLEPVLSRQQKAAITKRLQREAAAKAVANVPVSQKTKIKGSASKSKPKKALA